MILQTLTAHYRRLKNDPGSNMPSFGYSREKIGWAIELDNQGRVKQWLDLRDNSAKKKYSQVLTVPLVRQGKRAGKNPPPNFLWDKSDFVLGVDNEQENVQEYFNLFKNYHLKYRKKCTDVGFLAVCSFLESWKPENFQTIQLKDEIAGQNIVFRLAGEQRFVHEREDVRKLIDELLKEEVQDSVVAQCLLTGEVVPVARLHGAVKGIMKPKSVKSMKAEHTLVGFNLDSFTSYNKEQNFNAPVSKQAAFEYVTALNFLLRFESRQKLLLGDTTMVFWAEKPARMEQSLFYFFNPPEEKEDDEENSQKQENLVIDKELSQKINVFLQAVREGVFSEFETEKDTRFFILGLAPNAARLSVRFWYESTVEELAQRLHRHFKQAQIETQYADEPPFPAFWKLLAETAVQRKSENVSPLLGGALMRSVLTGAKYPESLLSACIGRIRAEAGAKDKNGNPMNAINYRRMSMIKACIVRNHNKEVPMSLDKTKKDVPYLLGRLFAIFEKAQEDAAGGKLNSTIKDRYFSSASATPRSIFPILIRLNQHHVSKGEHGGYYSKLIGEVMEDIPPDNLPTHLPLEDQGLFAIGYYHQRNDFFKKHEQA